MADAFNNRSLVSFVIIKIFWSQSADRKLQAIALHTFWVLFLRLQVRTLVMVAALVAVWAGIATLVISGPAALPTKKDGPFCKLY